MTHRLCWLTDIHLDHLISLKSENGRMRKEYSKEKVLEFASEVLADKPDSIVITGDISIAPMIETHLSWLQEGFGEVPIRFVLGNHDYYDGSIAEVRRNLSGHKNPNLCWLNVGKVISLTPTTALVGHDGWYDGEYSDWFKSKLMMTEYYVTKEFVYQPPTLVYKKIRELAQECANHIKKYVAEAAQTHKKVIFATHVPPFRDNSRAPDFRLSDIDWLPNMSSGLAGNALLDVARAHPGVEFICLSGHTHTPWKQSYGPNLHCWTGSAKYGIPKLSVEMIEIT